MASTQELLAAMSNIQPDAQAGLPVIPNNGNPRGAYNMPPRDAAEAAVTRPPAVQKDFSWLQPSQYMKNIQEMLSQRKTGGNMPQMNTGTVQPSMPMLQTGGPAQMTPTMPMRNERPELPTVLPQRQRINEYLP